MTAFPNLPGRVTLFCLAIIVIWEILFRGEGQASDLTLDAAIQAAFQNNKDLKTASYVVAIAKARLVQSGLSPNPRLSLSGYDAIFTNEPNEYELGIGFTQKFPVAGRIARQKDVAMVDVEQARTEIRKAKLGLASQVARVFYRILVLDRQIHLRNRLIQIDQDLLDASHSRYRVAEVSEIDVNTAQLELERLHQEKYLLKTKRAFLFTRLNQLLGRSSDMPLLLDERLPPLSPLPNLVEEQHRALALRPELQSAKLAIDRSRAQLGLAKARKWEDWTAGLGILAGQTVFPNGLSTGNDVGPSFVLSIPLPLWNKNQGQIAEAISAVHRSTTHTQALVLRIQNEVAGIYGEADRLLEAVQRYRSGMLKLSDRNMLLAQQAYVTGQVSILTVAQAERQHGDQHIGYENALGQYLQALVALHSAVGDYLGTSIDPNIRYFRRENRNEE